MAPQLLTTILWAVSATFLALRIVLYVFLVSMAWYAIVEEHVYCRAKHKAGPRRKTSGSKHATTIAPGRTMSSQVPVVKTQLEEGVTTTQPRSPQKAVHSHTVGDAQGHEQGGDPQEEDASSALETSSSISDTESSIASWSIWDAEEASEGLPGAADDESSATHSPGSAPGTPTHSRPQPTRAPPLAPRPPPPHARPRVPHPLPVTVAPVPTPVDALTPSPGTAGDVTMADSGAEVVPAAVAAAGADKGDLAVLEQAGASLAGGDIFREPSKEYVKQTRHGSKKENKSFLVRKAEKYLFKPMHDKYEKLGYMTFKGFGRMGRRMERGMRVTGAQVSVAMNNAGVVALESVDHLIKKWVMFFGLLMGLTIALLPMPSSLHLDVKMAG